MNIDRHRKNLDRVFKEDKVRSDRLFNDFMAICDSGIKVDQTRAARLMYLCNKADQDLIDNNLWE